jgi:D-alanyl-D-alanine carboxypeptidase/D-alanyl-D-alanine-endopeptidase (penicillin-binding protein 4)
MRLEKTSVFRGHVTGILLMGLLLSYVADSWAGQLPAPIEQALRAQGIPADAMSLYAQPVSAASPALAVNESVPRNPASLMKLLTSVVALDTLGPNFHWRTEAYTTGTLRKGVLRGDLILKGYGDPYLTPERFWQFAQGLRERGLREIRGDVIVDGSYIAVPEEGRGDFDGRPRRAYNALPHALSLNFQTTRLHLLPDRSEEAVRVFTYPPLSNLDIRNAMELVPGPCQQRHLRPVVRLSENDKGATLKVHGRYSELCPEWSGVYLVMDPVFHVGGAFSALWEEMGGRLTGTIRTGPVPANASLFHTGESPPLAEVMRSMNKYSNNLMSRLLLLTVAAQARGTPGTVEAGRSVVASWLEGHRLPSAGVRVSNGSGLARDARLSAKLLGRLLLEAFDSPFMPELMASLPLVGIDGTMRRRFRDTELAGRAHIKTGSLDGVSGIAGYVQDRYDRRWVVVLLLNHPGMMYWEGKRVQDAVLRWVYDGPMHDAGKSGKVAGEAVRDCQAQRQSQILSTEAAGGT